MRLNKLAIDDVVEIVPRRSGDARGYFSETFRTDWFGQNVAQVDFVQENQSLSTVAGTIRGLHFQAEPFAQGKLVRCVTGAIFDVAVDIRHGSASYGKWVGLTLSAEEGNQLWIPPGFLHGFCTLVPDVLVSYKVTSYYSGPHDRGVMWNDADIGIAWPEIAAVDLLSEKDTKLPRLIDLPEYFSIGKDQ